MDARTSTTIDRRALLRGAATLGGVAALAALPRPALAATAASSTLLPPGTGTGPLAHRYAPDVLLGWLEVVFDQVRQERFTPPAAARAYGAVAVAAYEAVVAGAPAHRSLGGQLNGLRRAPAAAAGGALDWRAAVNASVAEAAVEAFAAHSEQARAALDAYALAVHRELVGEVGSAAATRGARHGAAVGGRVAAWLATDGYTASRGLPYEPPTGPSLWVPTPPNFGTAIEPHWGTVRPFALRDGAECTPVRPVPYSEAAGSAFHAQGMAVHDAARGLTDAQRDTAMYWRDNPDGVTGLPAGHWMQIAAVVAAERDLVGAAELLALVGTCIADGFTSCWVEKYRTNLLRPVTYIQRVIDPGWSSFVNSPQFPEYTSGHSVGSGAAARALTTLVGAVPFTDAGAVTRGYVPRSFSSFQAAADEAAVSRLYGGIHFPMGIEAGVPQGARVADVVLGRVRTRR